MVEHLFCGVASACFFILCCHFDGNVFIMNASLPLAPATPVASPKQEAGMLGFHDANEVKTWQCAAGSL